MCRAGAAERAYPCAGNGLPGCRAAGPPDVRLAREGIRHGGLFTEVFIRQTCMLDTLYDMHNAHITEPMHTLHGEYGEISILNTEYVHFQGQM